MNIKLGAVLSSACGLGASMFLGAALMTAGATPAAAQAATSCNGGNVSGFNRTAPAGGAANVNQAGTFFVGDVITATATGLVLSVALDVNPGSNLLLFLNNTTGSGSFTFPSTGTFTISGAVNAQGGGSASVSFTCVSGPGAEAAGGNDLTPQQVITVTDNAHETTRVNEDRLEQEMWEEEARLQQEYWDEQFGDGPPPQFIPVPDNERAALEKRLAELRQREHELEKELEPIDQDIENANDARKYYEERKRNPPFDREAALVRQMYGVDVDADAGFRRRMDSEIAQIDEKLGELHEQSSEARTELEAVQAEITETFNALKYGRPNPEATNYFTGAPAVDRFDREFNAIVRHFDEQNPDSSSLPPLSARTALDKKTVAWVRASYTDFSQDDASRQEGDTIMIGAGVHRDFWEDIRIGVFVTTAWSDTKSSVNNLKVDSRSYGVGLYASYLVDGLTLSAGTSYGWSDSDIRVTTSTGSYDADKFNVTLSASGTEALNSVVWVRHTTSVSSTWSQRDAYTNSAGTVVGSTDVWGGRLALGPTIGMTLDKTETFAVIEPSLGLIGSYVFSDRDSQGGQVPTTESDYFGLAVAPGLTFATHGGTSLSLNTQYFGIGSDLSGWTVGGTLSVPFN